MPSVTISADTPENVIRLSSSESEQAPIALRIGGEGRWPTAILASLSLQEAQRLAYQILAATLNEHGSSEHFRMETQRRVITIDLNGEEASPVRFAMRSVGAQRWRHSFLTVPQAKKLAYRLLETTALLTS